jgi:hypothetical protein
VNFKDSKVSSQEDRNAIHHHLHVFCHGFLVNFTVLCQDTKLN